jgi:hypothetical protein
MCPVREGFQFLQSAVGKLEPEPRYQGKKQFDRIQTNKHHADGNAFLSSNTKIQKLQIRREFCIPESM